MALVGTKCLVRGCLPKLLRVDSLLLSQIIKLYTNFSEEQIRITFPFILGVKKLALRYSLFNLHQNHSKINFSLLFATLAFVWRGYFPCCRLPGCSSLPSFVDLLASSSFLIRSLLYIFLSFFLRVYVFLSGPLLCIFLS